MAHLGYPWVGDSLYAGRFKIHKGAPAELIDFLRHFGRQALHAAELALVHPASGEEVSWTAPLPEDFQMLLSQLSNENTNV